MKKKCFKCSSTKNISIDFRPSYINSDGDGGCMGKVLTCDACRRLSDKNWVKASKKIQKTKKH